MLKEMRLCEQNIIERTDVKSFDQPADNQKTEK